MLKFIIKAISRGLGFTKTEAKGTIVLIFIILLAIISTQTRISYFKDQLVITPDSSAIAWINEVHNSYSVRQPETYDEEDISELKKVVDNTQIKKQYPEKNNIKKNIDNKKSIVLDINTATAGELQKVKGIGPTFSERIIKYRDLLGGFSDTTQLYEVYGLKEPVIKNILRSFKIDAPVVQLNINNDSIKYLARHPYISYDLAQVIVNYRKEHGDINSADDLLKIKALDERTFMRLKPYLE
ncbi:ComEA family DNA-binding protein [Ekhidna sp.]|uniref:ComEA family DNA-binding protein n=1 Tax=Ekhidna sp. TaxID=2608089 RepID=UPI003B509D09